MSDEAEKQLRNIKIKQGGEPGNEAEMELVLILIFQVCPTTYNLLHFFFFFVFLLSWGRGHRHWKLQRIFDLIRHAYETFEYLTSILFAMPSFNYLIHIDL